VDADALETADEAMLLAVVSDSALKSNEYVMAKSDAETINTNPSTAALVHSVFPDRDPSFFLAFGLFNAIITSLRHELFVLSILHWVSLRPRTVEGRKEKGGCENDVQLF
jgi:hypothetical protein